VKKPKTKLAAFVCGFFGSLEARGVRSVVLHGGADGFERELSDVDFAVAPSSFHLLPSLVAEHCAATGWRLCQILRHETTASYFVCSANDDPACAVALDACSDYQRNGMVFLAAATLLQERVMLPWGGHALPRSTELRYRFAKAAAKNKGAAASAHEFATYTEEDRNACADWLSASWNLSLRSWDVASLAPVLEALRGCSRGIPALSQSGAPARVLSRIVNPSGLIVITGRSHHDDVATRLEQIFGRLYFRRTLKAPRWRPALFKELVTSTLILLPELSATWAKLIPGDCILRIDPSRSIEPVLERIAGHLQERCRSREARQEKRKQEELKAES
jgi:hypothetical protein